MEINDILSILDIEAGEDATPESLTEAIKAKWVPRALAHEDAQIAGRVLGGTETGVKRILKSVADTLGLEDADIQAFKISNLGKDDAENNPLLKGTERVKSRIAELQNAKPAKGNTEAMKEWEQKIEDAKKQANEYKEMLANVNKEFEGYKTQVSEKEKAFKIDHAYEQALASFNLSSEVNNIQKLGFNTHIKSKYKFTVGDEGDIQVWDMNGNSARNAKGSDIASLKEVLEMELNEAKMLAKNNGAATPAKPTFRAAASGSDKELTPAMRKSQEHAARLRQAQAENNA